MVAPGICHVKARLVDLIGSSGIENATSAQPKNLASAPRLSPLRFFGGVAGDETTVSNRNLHFLSDAGFLNLEKFQPLARFKVQKLQ